MVQLVEVEDEHFQQPQPGPEEDDDDFTDTGKPFPSFPAPTTLSLQFSNPAHNSKQNQLTTQLRLRNLRRLQLRPHRGNLLRPPARPPRHRPCPRPGVGRAQVRGRLLGRARRAVGGGARRLGRGRHGPARRRALRHGLQRGAEPAGDGAGAAHAGARVRGADDGRRWWREWESGVDDAGDFGGDWRGEGGGEGGAVIFSRLLRNLFLFFRLRDGVVLACFYALPP
ncbi:hypothetical protein VTJ49DRAFT_74 [Mycothermus thermophilus]|uniref:Uncharacterized protein n=1 Tax=Humicola insolens TaxID=85995 RepID=A0ABR3VRW3_HUMIN